MKLWRQIPTSKTKVMIGFLLSGKGNNYLLVAVDSFNKTCILIPCKTQLTTEQTNQLFFQLVWVHFKISDSILSNQDSLFLGKFWSNLWGLMDTKVKKRTTFHPHTDIKTEVVNRTFIQLIWGYCSKHPKLWDELLQYIHHAYNQQNTLLLRNLFLRLILSILPKHHWIFLLEFKKMWKMDILLPTQL